MNAYRALARGERPRDARAWLQTVALNVCREHYRRAGRRPVEVSFDPGAGERSLDSDPGDLVLDPPGPEFCDVVRGLSCLPFNQRAALVMREFEGRSVAEIATALEVSVPAVEALLFRARRSLREQLEEKLTCAEAEHAISRQLDGSLARRERGRLRAHLRECGDCAALARRVRAQRSALRSLALLPLPASLRLCKLGGSGAAAASAAGSTGALGPAGGSLVTTLGGAVGAKVAVATIAGLAAIGIGYEAEHPRVPHVASSNRPKLPAATPSARRSPMLVAAHRVGQGARLSHSRGSADKSPLGRTDHIPARRAFGYLRKDHSHLAVRNGHSHLAALSAASLVAPGVPAARHSPTSKRGHRSDRHAPTRSSRHTSNRPSSTKVGQRSAQTGGHTAQPPPAKRPQSGSGRNP